MQHLVWPAAGLALSLVVVLLSGPIRMRMARRRERRITAGRSVSFPARIAVDGGKLRRARLFREGDRIFVRSWRSGWFLPVTTARIVSSTAPDVNDPVGEWRMERHTAPGGRIVELGTRIEDRSALAALRRAPSARRPKVASWATSVAALAGIGALLLTVLYGVSYDATGTVRTVNDGADSCLVEWAHAGVQRRTHVDCGSYDAASIGMSVPIVAQPAPFEGQAFSGSRDEIWSIDGTIAVAAGIVLLLGVWRARPPKRVLALTPVLVPASESATGGVVVPSGSDTAGSAPVDRSIVALARRSTVAAGWGAEGRNSSSAASTSPTRGQRIWADLMFTRGATGWWTPVVLLVGLSLWPDLPDRVRPVVAAVAGLALLVQVFRALGVWRTVHGLWQQPVNSEWNCVGLPAPGGYSVLLCLGDQPCWLVDVASIPPAQCRMQVRGDLGDERVVHLVPEGTTEVFLGLPIRMSPELEDEIRAFLSDELDEPVPDSHV